MKAFDPFLYFIGLYLSYLTFNYFDTNISKNLPFDIERASEREKSSNK